MKCCNMFVKTSVSVLTLVCITEYRETESKKAS
jgi:hypothetical protein